MSEATPEYLRAALVSAIRGAYRAGLGIPASLQPLTGAYARAQREAGIAVEKVIIEVKEIIRTETGDQDLLFIPRLVGWIVAGYFAGAARRGEA